MHYFSNAEQATLKIATVKKRASPRISATDSNVRVSVGRQVKTKSRMPAYRFLTNEGLRRHFAVAGRRRGRERFCYNSFSTVTGKSRMRFPVA
jgi:hypothetical protein